MTTSKLVKTIVFVALLVAASAYVGNIGRQIGQLGDAALALSISTLYPPLSFLSIVHKSTFRGIDSSLESIWYNRTRPNMPGDGGPVYAVEDGRTCSYAQPSTCVFGCFVIRQQYREGGAR